MEIKAQDAQAVQLAGLTGHDVADCAHVLKASSDDLDMARRMLEYAATQDRSRWTQVAIATRMARKARLAAGAEQVKGSS